MSDSFSIGCSFEYKRQYYKETEHKESFIHFIEGQIRTKIFVSQNCSTRETYWWNYISIFLLFIFRSWYKTKLVFLLLNYNNVAFVMASAMNKSVSDAPNKNEETYQLLEQLDHILKRPETYIGSNRPCREVKFRVFCFYLYKYFFF